jgi:porphobilinogen deaminase
VPIGALAVGSELHGFVSSVDGRQSLRGHIALDRESPERSGRALAEQLRDKGATKILATFERQKGMPAPQPE